MRYVADESAIVTDLGVKGKSGNPAVDGDARRVLE